MKRSLIRKLGLALLALITPALAWAANPTPVLLVDFGNDKASDTGWTALTPNGVASFEHTDTTSGVTIAGAISSSKLWSSVDVANTTGFASAGTFESPSESASYGSPLEEMAATLGLPAAPTVNTYGGKVTQCGGGGTYLTLTLSNLTAGQCYTLYVIVGHGTVPPTFKITNCGTDTTPTVHTVTNDATAYTKLSSYSANVVGTNASDIILIRAYNIYPTSDKKITLQVGGIDTHKGGINALALATTDYVEIPALKATLESESETWDDQAWESTPTADDDVELTVTSTTSSTLDLGATSVEVAALTVKESDYALTMTNGSLTAGATKINADTDVSGITADLGAVTIASGKALSIGANTELSIAPGTDGNVGANAGTLRVVGGSSEDPIELSAGTAAHHYIGAVTVAENSVLKLHATGGNKTYNITGNGETSHVILTSSQNWGVSNNDNSKIQNCTLEIPQKIPGTDTDNSNFWLTPSKIGENVHLVLNRQLCFENDSNAGTLNILSLSGSGTVIANGSHTVKITDGATQTYSGAIQGTHSVVKEGEGTQIFSGANTYSGTTTISGGTLKVAENGSLGTGTITVDANGTLTYTANATPTNTFTGTGTITADGCTLNLAKDADVSSYTGAYSVINDGILILKAGTEANTTVTSGTLRLQLSASQLATGYTAQVATGTTVEFYNGDTQITTGVENGVYTPQTPMWTPTAATSTWDDTACWTNLTDSTVPTSGNIVINTAALTEAIAVEIPSSFNTITVNGNETAITSVSFATDVTAAPAVTIVGLVAFPYDSVTGTATTFTVDDDAGYLIVDIDEDKNCTANLMNKWNFGKAGSGKLTFSAALSGTKKLRVFEGTLLVNNNANGNYKDTTITIDEGATLAVSNNNANYNPLCGGGTIVNNGTFTYSSTADSTDCHLWATMSGTGKVVIEKGIYNLHDTNTYTGGTEIAEGATVQVAGLGTLGASGDVTIADGGKLNIYVTEDTKDQDQAWNRLKGNGTVAYNSNGSWHTFPNVANPIPTTLAVENNLANGLILPEPGQAYKVGSLSGTGAFRVDFGGSADDPRSLEIIQSKNTTFSGGMLTDNNPERLSGFYLSGAEGATDKTLTYSGTTTVAKSMTINASGVLNLTGTWTGDMTVNGTIGSSDGKGVIKGALTLADGATIDATTGAVAVEGTVTLGTVTATVASDAGIGTEILTCSTASLDLNTITIDGVEGMVAEANDDGTAIVLAEAVVYTASANGVDYATIAEAVFAVKSATDKTVTIIVDSEEDVMLLQGVTLTVADGINYTGAVTDIYGNPLEADENGDYSCPVYVATITDTEKTTGYASLQAAVDDAQDGETIQVLTSLTLTDTVTLNDAAKAITIDLNSGMHSSTAATAIQVTNGTLTLKTGAITASGVAVQLGTKNANPVTTSKLVVAADASLASMNYALVGGEYVFDGDNVVLMYGNATLETAGSLTTYSTEWAAIQGSGGDLTANTTITISGGTVASENNHAIYHPQPGTLTITGGTISGVTGIEMRAGTLNMQGGTVTATGAYVAPTSNSNGSTVEGAAIVLSQHVTGENVTANITGGEITATSGKTFVVANTTGADPVDVEATIEADVTIDVSKAEVLIETLELTGSDEEGYTLTEVVVPSIVSVTIEDVTTEYSTLAEALAALADGATLTLLDDVELTEGVTISHNITLAIGEYTLTIPTGTTVTVAAGKTLTVTCGAGGLAVDGTIAVDGTLDVSALAYGTSGLLSGKAGSLAIASTGTVKLMSVWDAYSPNWLMENSPAFFEGTEDGATIIQGSKTTSYDATTGAYLQASAVATTEVTVFGKTYLEGFDSLQEAYDNAAENGTITLLGDTTGKGLKINKAITIDFGGKTYTVNHAVGSTGTETLGMQITAPTTLQNGTLTCISCDLSYEEATEDAVKALGYTSVKPVRMLINNYAGVTLINMVLDGSGLAPMKDDVPNYVLSNNAGENSIDGSSTIKAPTGGHAFDSCGEDTEVTVEAGATIIGTVEVSGGTLDNDSTKVLDVVISSGKVEGVVKVDTTKSTYLVEVNGVYCNKAVDANGKDASDAAKVFTGIATGDVDGTTATVDWDFGISDIKVNRDTNGSLKDVTITAKVQKNATTAAGYADGVTVTVYADGSPLAPATVATDGTATLTVDDIDAINGKELTVKVSK